MSEAERLKRDLSQLVDPASAPPPLAPRAPASAIASGVGSARPRPPSASQTAAGIAAPLTEVGSGGVATARTYHASSYLYSSDGMVAIKRRPVAGTEFTDALGRAVPFVIQQPPA